LSDRLPVYCPLVEAGSALLGQNQKRRHLEPLAQTSATVPETEPTDRQTCAASAFLAGF
jgi:hypothetical protein